MSENDIKNIVIDTINEFTEDMKLENLNVELNSRLVMSDGDEPIQSDESARDNTHGLFRDLRKFDKFKKGRVNG